MYTSLIKDISSPSWENREYVSFLQNKTKTVQKCSVQSLRTLHFQMVTLYNLTSQRPFSIFDSGFKPEN